MNRLKEVRKARGFNLRELEKITGINKSIICRIEKGQRKLRADEAIYLAKILDVSTSYLIGDSPINEEEQQAVKIPILGEVVACIPIEAIENVVGYEEISLEQSKLGEFFALKIKGKSMEPYILEGDIVIIKKQNCCDNGDIAVVLINGEEATVKKVYKNNNSITLIAYNHSVFPPHQYSEQECLNLPITIIGKVVEVRRRF